MSDLYSGAGRADIVFPQELFPMQGFCGIHDDPTVRILYLRSDEPMALAVYELVMMPDDLIDSCRQRIADKLTVDKNNVWLHMTHAITTPHAPGGPLIGPGGNIIEQTKEQIEQGKKDKETYYEAVLKATETAAAQTAADIRRSRMSVGVGDVKLVMSRDIHSDAGWWIGREPMGETDHELTVLSFSDSDGAPVALLYNYAMKPCVVDNSGMKENKRLISSDAPGYACRLLEERYGVPVLFTMGAAGDQIPIEVALYDEIRDGEVITIDLGVEKGFEYVEEIGQRLCDDVVRICDKAAETDVDHVGVTETSFTYATKGRMPMKLRTDVEYVKEGQTEVPIHAAVIGPVVVVGTKPEINCITKKQLKAASPAKYTLLMSMVNGGMKYMPDKGSYEKITWEAQTAMLMPGAAEVFVEKAKELIKKINDIG